MEDNTLKEEKKEEEEQDLWKLFIKWLSESSKSKESKIADVL